MQASAIKVADVSSSLREFLVRQTYRKDPVLAQEQLRDGYDRVLSVLWRMYGATRCQLRHYIVERNKVK